MKTLAIRKKLVTFNLINLNDCVNYYFYNYLKSMENSFIGSLNLYFYYFGFFVKSINPFNLLLFYFLKITEIFEQFEYNEFCPDLKCSNCLNLIILFFKLMNH